MEPLEFVFSLRSPYAWIAASRVLPQLPAGTPIRWRPFFPLPSFTNFPPVLRAKRKYLIRDVTRLTSHYGLPLQWPEPDEPDWAVPHVAFEEADSMGQGPAFALQMYGARFSHGQNLADPLVIRAAATAVGLDPEHVLDAAKSAARHARLAAQIEHDYTEREIFGVPTLILPKGTRFWGHDRIEWALREGLLDDALHASA